ncbi:uncharacterized protein LOC100373645 [Saccoglossus kowalevskii]|uniref:Uncharacterized protein LOC100373645 n=1 Tax=Saccoglossus kowalevskii TaxID=10224 RepID=A0ABM0MYG1_SACKO|nr:PREDICTED: uncharacterized protein LOC100373645 [Saccoglossus kowalevskii]
MKKISQTWRQQKPQCGGNVGKSTFLKSQSDSSGGSSSFSKPITSTVVAQKPVLLVGNSIQDENLGNCKGVHARKRLGQHTILVSKANSPIFHADKTSVTTNKEIDIDNKKRRVLPASIGLFEVPRRSPRLRTKNAPRCFPNSCSTPCTNKENSSCVVTGVVSKAETPGKLSVSCTSITSMESDIDDDMLLLAEQLEAEYITGQKHNASIVSGKISQAPVNSSSKTSKGIKQISSCIQKSDAGDSHVTADVTEDDDTTFTSNEIKTNTTNFTNIIQKQLTLDDGKTIKTNTINLRNSMQMKKRDIKMCNTSKNNVQVTDTDDEHLLFCVNPKQLFSGILPNLGNESPTNVNGTVYCVDSQSPDGLTHHIQPLPHNTLQVNKTVKQDKHARRKKSEMLDDRVKENVDAVQNTGSAVKCNQGASTSAINQQNSNSDCQKSPVESTPNRKLLSSWGLPSSVLQRYHDNKITEMFDWQAECLSQGKVLSGGNLVYSAPTSAGKTMVAELLILKRVLETKQKAIVILPFVSVAREKMFYLQRMFEECGVRVEGYMGNMSPAGGFASLDVAVCTIEKANSLINRLLEENKLNQLGAIVVDELHMVGDSHRGYLLELLLTKIRYVSSKVVQKKEDTGTNGDKILSNTNPIQIIGMSATLPNLDLLARWLDADLYKTDFRPVPLEECVKIGDKIYNSELKKLREISPAVQVSGDDEHIIPLCFETITNGHSVLIFCPTKNWCEKLSEMIAKQIFKVFHQFVIVGPVKASQLVPAQFNKQGIIDVLEQLKRTPVGIDSVLKRTVPYAVAYHHAGLTFDERDIIEGAFRQGILKILIATSTLSSGVNLPARRVIIRTPMFNRRLLDVLTYKQMSGRAGRKGVDTMGESILICKSNERSKGQHLMQTELKPVCSCLVKENGEETTSSMKRAILEVIVSGVATSPSDVDKYASCTLLAASLTTSESTSNFGSIQNCIKFLVDNEFIRLHQVKNGAESSDKYVATQLGSATLSSSLSPDEALVVFSELQRARKSFVLENELHILYQVTPIYDQGIVNDWYRYIDIWETLSIDKKRVGELVGIEERFLARAVGGSISTSTFKQQRVLAIHKRFYTAMILEDLVNEIPIAEVSRKYSVPKGQLQSLQQSAATFSGMVTVFCSRLGWINLEILLEQFQNRLNFGVQRELCDLVRISLLNGQRARILYNGGYHTIANIAQADPIDIENLLRNSVPFHSVRKAEHEEQYEAEERKKIRCIWATGKKGLTEAEAANLIVAEAKQCLKGDVGLLGVQWNPNDVKTTVDGGVGAALPLLVCKSEVAREALLHIISKIEICRETQQEIDEIYDDLYGFDANFYEHILHHLDDPLYDSNSELNKNFPTVEIKTVVAKAKSGKAVGVDKILVRKAEHEEQYEAEERKKTRCIWATGKKGLTEAEAANLIVAEAKQCLKGDVGLLGVQWNPNDVKTTVDGGVGAALTSPSMQSQKIPVRHSSSEKRSILSRVRNRRKSKSPRDCAIPAAKKMSGKKVSGMTCVLSPPWKTNSVDKQLKLGCASEDVSKEHVYDKTGVNTCMELKEGGLSTDCCKAGGTDKHTTVELSMQHRGEHVTSEIHLPLEENIVTNTEKMGNVAIQPTETCVIVNDVSSQAQKGVLINGGGNDSYTQDLYSPEVINKISPAQLPKDVVKKVETGLKGLPETRNHQQDSNNDEGTTNDRITTNDRVTLKCLDGACLKDDVEENDLQNKVVATHDVSANDISMVSADLSFARNENMECGKTSKADYIDKVTGAEFSHNQLFDVSMASVDSQVLNYMTDFCTQHDIVAESASPMLDNKTTTRIQSQRPKLSECTSPIFISEVKRDISPGAFGCSYDGLQEDLALAMNMSDTFSSSYAKTPAPSQNVTSSTPLPHEHARHVDHANVAGNSNQRVEEDNLGSLSPVVRRSEGGHVIGNPDDSGDPVDMAYSQLANDLAIAAEITDSFSFSDNCFVTDNPTSASAGIASSAAGQYDDADAGQYDDADLNLNSPNDSGGDFIPPTPPDETFSKTPKLLRTQGFSNKLGSPLNFKKHPNSLQAERESSKETRGIIEISRNDKRNLKSQQNKHSEKQSEELDDSPSEELDLFLDINTQDFDILSSPSNPCNDPIPVSSPSPSIACTDGSFAIVDVCTNVQLFETFMKEWRSKSKYSFSLACEKHRKNIIQGKGIGANFHKVSVDALL